MATRKNSTPALTPNEAELKAAEEQARIDEAVTRALKAAGGIREYVTRRCLGCWTNAVQMPAEVSWTQAKCETCGENGNNLYNSADLLIHRKMGSIGGQFIPNIAVRISKISGYTLEQLLAYGDDEIVSVEQLCQFYDEATKDGGFITRPKSPSEKALAAKVQEYQKQRDVIRAKKSRLSAIETQIDSLTIEHAKLADEVADLSAALGEEA